MTLRSKNDRLTTAASAHMGMVKRLRCVCCLKMGRNQTTPTEVHHIRAAGQSRNDFLTIPLCADCHRGPNGVELNQVYLAVLKMNEWDLLAHVIELISLRTLVMDDDPF